MNARTQRWTEATATAVKAGQYVAWSASKGTSKGRVVSLHTGKVPGVIGAFTATTDAPAARVQLYAKTGTGWEATSVHIAQPVYSLASIDPLPEPTVAATEAVAGSFDDIRSIVEDAIKDQAESFGAESPWIYVCDIGPTWAVYQANDGDLWMVDYTIDAAGVVTLGDRTEVTKVTSYVPEVEPVDGTTGQPIAEAVRDHIESRLIGAAGATADGGRIFDVEIIRYGDSKNGRRYPEAVMRTAAPLYEGAKAYDHHRTDAELNTSTVQGLVGHYRNVEATTTGLKGQLHLLPSALHVAEALDSSLANQAAGLPPLVGISHDVQTRSRRVGNITECMQIIKVNSSDVVADPAAGGAVTRMVAGGIVTTQITTTTTKGTSMLTFKQLLALLRTTESANRAALLTEHASVLTNAGYTGDEALRMAEAVEAPAPVRTTEAAPAYDKTSPLSRVLIRESITEAKLDAAKFTEAITGELPDRFTEAELATAIVRYQRATEAAGLTPTVPHVEVTADAVDKFVEAFDLMLDSHKAGGYRSLKHAHHEFGKLTGARQTMSQFDSGYEQDLFRECTTVRRDGERFMYDSERSTESVTVATFGKIFGDSITRRLIAEYQQPSLQTWRAIVSSFFNLTDFRTQRIIAMGGYGVLPTVNQGAPYNPLTSPTDEESTYAATKRGGTEDWTLEASRNDDLRALQRIPQKLGLAAAQTLFRFVWDMIQTNPTLTRDSVALFNAGHNNTTSTALSSTSLEATRVKMRTQAAFGDTSDILSLVPKYLLVPSALETLAFQLCTSAVAIPSGAPVGAASNTPNIHQGMTPIVVDYWNASSATQWYVAADPNMCPTIELGFLDGKEEPSLFMQADDTTGAPFDADKVVIKVRHIYGGAPIEFRGLQRGNV